MTTFVIGQSVWWVGVDRDMLPVVEEGTVQEVLSGSMAGELRFKFHNTTDHAGGNQRPAPRIE